MNRVTTINSIALIVTFGLAIMAGARTAPALDSLEPKTVAQTPANRSKTQGHQRIVSASVVADEILLELVEPTRVIAFTRFSQQKRKNKHRYLGKETISSIGDTEAILALQPDLVFAHNVGDPRPVERLRDSGIVVVDLGAVEGLDSLLKDIDEIAVAVDAPEAGQHLKESLVQQLRTVAADIPAHERKDAIFVTILGKSIYGGTIGSSYHTMLRFGGLRDVAADSFTGWPSLSMEDLLRLDPPWIVTVERQGASLCNRAGADRLKACSTKGRLIELPEELAGASGLGVIDAARAIRNAVYGSLLDDKIEER